MLLQIGAAPLSKFRVRVVTDLDDYDKLGQQLLQNRVPITNLRKQSTWTALVMVYFGVLCDRMPLMFTIPRRNC